MTENRKRIVVLIDWFVPAYKAGGPIQSCANFVYAMCSTYDLFVITGDTDLGEARPYVERSNEWTIADPHIHVYYFSKDNLSYSSLREVISEINPDFIYLNHMFSPYYVLMPLLMKWLGQVQGVTVVCPRGALFDSALHYKNTYLKKIVVLFMLRLFRIHKRVGFHATTMNEATAIQRFFPTDQISVVSNLLPNNQVTFKTIHKQSGELKLIFIARIVPIKNLLFALNILSSVRSTVFFTIVGPVEDEVYWEKCNAIIKVLPPNIKIDFLGPKAKEELSVLLLQHHLFILPTTGENFGHSIVESFLAGRPVIISDQTPWRNLLQKTIGWDLSLKQPELFIHAVEEAAAWDQTVFDLWASQSWKFAARLTLQTDEKKKYEHLFS